MNMGVRGGILIGTSKFIQIHLNPQKSSNLLNSAKIAIIPGIFFKERGGGYF